VSNLKLGRLLIAEKQRSALLLSRLKVAEARAPVGTALSHPTLSSDIHVSSVQAESMTSLLPLLLFPPSSSSFSSSSSSDRVDSGVTDYQTCSSSSSSSSSCLPHIVLTISPVLDPIIHDAGLLKVTSLEEPWVTMITSRDHRDPLDSLSHVDLLHMILNTDMNIPYDTINNPVILLASKIFRMDLTNSVLSVPSFFIFTLVNAGIPIIKSLINKYKASVKDLLFYKAQKEKLDKLRSENKWARAHLFLSDVELYYTC
jgi:hypothetical protein